jgi:uncharacterized membrane protein
LKRKYGMGLSKSRMQQYRFLIIFAAAVMVLLAVSLVFQQVFVYPQTEFFTELSILGPEHKAENYPYNITSNEDYHVFLGITNHLGSSVHYQVEVKFRNELQSAPNSLTRTASTLPSLYNIDATVADNESWELPVTFRIDYSLADSNEVVFKSIKLNDATLPLTGLTTTYNSTTGIYYGNLVFELWVYNDTINAFQYHERFVDLKFNMNNGG